METNRSRPVNYLLTPDAHGQRISGKPQAGDNCSRFISISPGPRWTLILNNGEGRRKEVSLHPINSNSYTDLLDQTFSASGLDTANKNIYHTTLKPSLELKKSLLGKARGPST